MPAPAKDRARRTELRRAENARAANRAAARARGQDYAEAYRPDTITQKVYDAVEGGLGYLIGRDAPRVVGNIKELTEGLVGPDTTERAVRRTLGGRGELEDYLLAGLTVAPGLGRLAGKYAIAPAIRAVARRAPRAVETVERAATVVPRLRPQAPIEGASPRGPSAFPKRAAPAEAPQLTPRQEAFNAGPKLAVPTFSRVAPTSPYLTKTVGPFLHIKREGAEPLIVPEAEGATLNQQRALLANPETNQPLSLADEYTREAMGRSYDMDLPDPGTSLAKQAGIGRVFQLAAEGSPEYKSALFERYGQLMPDVVEKSGAQNYDQLTEAAYRQMGTEVDQQFDRLPIELRYNFGEGEYARPSGMLADVLGRGRLNVFRGGDPHPYLSDIDPETGLTANEKFRAVHDYFGHAGRGSTFRPGGEEIAYASHSQMMSPLAQMGLLSETRGQNSWVNYGTANADLSYRMNRIRDEIAQIEQVERMRGPPGASAAELAPLNAQLRELGAQTQFAPQLPLLLPPEYLPANTKGGVPGWLGPVNRPKAPSPEERAVHFSHSPGLTTTDPSFFGTGHRGDEHWIGGVPTGGKTSFYLGPEGTVLPESMVAAVAPHAYEARVKGLYDIQSDPEQLVQLAKAYNLKNMRMPVRKAGTEGTQYIPDLVKLVQDYGYSGYRNNNFLAEGRGAADVFEPVQDLRMITRGPNGYADGGIVE